MTDTPADDFFSAKHARLKRIASIANIFAWIALVVQILLTVFRLIEFPDLLSCQTYQDQFSCIYGMLTQSLLNTASLVVNMGVIFVRGMIYWLVLRGIALGLNMIVETDMNRRVKLQGQRHE